eukprot:13970049-Alexandrium_andersonii.AAC.1
MPAHCWRAHAHRALWQHAETESHPSCPTPPRLDCFRGPPCVVGGCVADYHGPRPPRCAVLGL